MTPRPAGLRDTPPRDVRESLATDDQAQLDTLQDLSIRRLERRWGLTMGVAMFAFTLAVLALLFATGRPAEAPPAPVPVRRVCPTVPACPTCPSLTCPSLVCPNPTPRRPRHHRD